MLTKEARLSTGEPSAIASEKCAGSRDKICTQGELIMDDLISCICGNSLANVIDENLVEVDTRCTLDAIWYLGTGVVP